MIYLLAEGPLQQGVIFASHDHEEEREMSASASAIAIQIESQTHLIAIFTGVEGWRIQNKWYRCVECTTGYKCRRITLPNKDFYLTL